MIISFDLDDLLIPSMRSFPTEPQNMMQRILGMEKLRLGTIKLFKELRSKGHHIFIYTTSFRSPIKVKLSFRSNGVPIDKVINQKVHKMKCAHHNCSKYPPAFGIDVHVDDSPGVGIEGDRYNFRTIIVRPDDVSWVDQVLLEVAQTVK